MNLTPEKQKELIDASLKLATLAKRNTDDADEWREAIANVEKFRPEPERPKPIEGWINIYESKYSLTTGALYGSKDEAATKADGDLPLARSAVHMREVVPPNESLKWSYRKTASGFCVICGGKYIAGGIRNLSEVKDLVRTHNAALGFGKEGE